MIVLKRDEKESDVEKKGRWKKEDRPQTLEDTKCKDPNLTQAGRSACRTDWHCAAGGSPSTWASTASGSRSTCPCRPAAGTSATFCQRSRTSSSAASRRPTRGCQRRSGTLCRASLCCG